MGKMIEIIAYSVVLCGIFSGIYVGFIVDGFKLGIMLLYWISSIITGILLYAFSILYEMVEQNNMFLRMLLQRIPASEQQQISLGNSKANLDKLKDYKMSGSSQS